jgi:hypothetical protein
MKLERQKKSQNPAVYLTDKMNKLLLALYNETDGPAGQIFCDICEYANGLETFDENTEKKLHQIQTVFKKFKSRLLNHGGSNLKQCQHRLKKHMIEHMKTAWKADRHIDFATWEKNLNLDETQKKIMYQTAMTFQLSTGCSNFCRRCNEWALPKVRAHFSFESIVSILDQMAAHGNTDIALYGASDPLDWSENEKTILDVLVHLSTIPIDYSLLTKVPKGKNQLLIKLLGNRSNVSVSLTRKNKARVSEIENDLGALISKQHDLDELLIPAGLDEDFVSIKPSITDGYGIELTVDGAFIIIPTFTSALHPFGHQKIPVDRATCFFPVKKTGRTALLVDYFKPLEGYDLKGRRIRLYRLLNVQIETILMDSGTDALTPPGMRSLKEYFTIFDDPARLKRKQMTPAVLKKIKKQFLANRPYKSLEPKERAVYLKMIRTHLYLCQKSHCLSAKMAAISFFLGSIGRYVQENPIETGILKFLLKKEWAHRSRTMTKSAAGCSVEALLTDPNTDTFDCFRYMAFCLLVPLDPNKILTYIQTHPSRFDPIADQFFFSSS